jgi:hypothetical protein
VDWGSSSVFARSAQLLSAAGLRWRALRTIWDLDRPEDLERFAALPADAGRKPFAKKRVLHFDVQNQRSGIARSRSRIGRRRQ